VSAEPPDSGREAVAGVEPPDSGHDGPARGEPRVIDARGLRCPLPIIELARAARTTAPGDVLVVWWTDPTAEHDIPAWARMRGHQVLVTAPLTQSGNHDPAENAAYATTVLLSSSSPPPLPVIMQK